MAAPLGLFQTVLVIPNSLALAFMRSIKASGSLLDMRLANMRVDTFEDGTTVMVINSGIV